MTTRAADASLADVRVLDVRGPWKTKSAGALHVLFALPFAAVEQFLSYDPQELAAVPTDLRGLRSYTVRKLPAGKIGGTEFHRVRSEIIVGLEGEVEFTLEDLAGERMAVTLDASHAVQFPPYLMHTYAVRAEGSGILVIANTLFDPADARTHDTYSLEEFHALQAARRA